MALFESLIDLFVHGAVSIAEQFIRGTTSVGNFGQLMTNKYGDNYRVPLEAQSEFLRTVSLASVPASQIEQGNIPAIETIPLWQGGQFQGEFVHTGLSRVSVESATGENILTTHIPFNLSYKELLTREDILDRIRNAVQSGQGADQDFYQRNIDRLEQAIHYLRTSGFESKVTADIYSVFHGVEL